MLLIHPFLLKYLHFTWLKHNFLTQNHPVAYTLLYVLQRGWVDESSKICVNHWNTDLLDLIQKYGHKLHSRASKFATTIWFNASSAWHRFSLAFINYWAARTATHFIRLTNWLTNIPLFILRDNKFRQLKHKFQQ